VSLTGISLVLVNGNVMPAASYLTLDLGTAVDIPAHGYLVIGAQALLDTITADREIHFAGATDQIQNGGPPNPDGLALYDTSTGTLVDALSYEGSITMCTISGHTFSLVEGTALAATVADSTSVVGSLSRLPNGTDTDNAVTDWNFTSHLTPGAANM
jgi:hypothetical protein